MLLIRLWETAPRWRLIQEGRQHSWTAPVHRFLEWCMISLVDCVNQYLNSQVWMYVMNLRTCHMKRCDISRRLQASRSSTQSKTLYEEAHSHKYRLTALIRQQSTHLNVFFQCSVNCYFVPPVLWWSEWQFLGSVWRSPIVTMRQKRAPTVVGTNPHQIPESWGEWQYFWGQKTKAFVGIVF